MGLGERRFLLDLIAPTAGSQTGPVLGRLVREGPVPCIFLFPDFVCREIKFSESAPWKQLHFHYSSWE